MGIIIQGNPSNAEVIKLCLGHDTKLEFYQIRYRANADPLCWAYHLLRVRADKITDTKQCGIDINSSYNSYTLADFFNFINGELLRISVENVINK